MKKPEPFQVVHEVWKSKFPEAKFIFLAGSVVRKEETQYSDLDLVVVYDKLKNAWRESFVFQDWQIEAFVHDPETLKFFFEEMDAKDGIPSLPQMVLEGIAIPAESDSSNSLKKLAKDVLAAGPPALTEAEIKGRRYFISDMMDDLRSPRNREEAMATGTDLYSQLADLWLRGQRKWSAKGKTIPRVLKKADPALYAQFQQAFDSLFIAGESLEVVALAEKILLPHGGYLFADHRLDAPENWRK